MNAWLLTWEGTEGPAIDANQKIIAILSGRKSADVVANLVEVLYCRTVQSAGDMARLANRRRSREHQYRQVYSTADRLFYGRNPCIFARRVSNLRIERDASLETETVRWHEPATYRNAASGSEIEQALAARDCEHQRALLPLAAIVAAVGGVTY